jgi:hypothetical protein
MTKELMQESPNVAVLPLGVLKALTQFFRDIADRADLHSCQCADCLHEFPADELELDSDGDARCESCTLRPK